MAHHFDQEHEDSGKQRNHGVFHNRKFWFPSLATKADANLRRERLKNRERILTARSDGAFAREVLEKSDQQHLEVYGGIDTGIAAVGTGEIRSAEVAGFSEEIQFLEQCFGGVPELRRRTTAQFAGRNPQLGLDGWLLLPEHRNSRRKMNLFTINKITISYENLKRILQQADSR